MIFQVTILGTSSALPTADRYLSAQLLTFRDKNYLIDCGEGTQIQLRRFKHSFQRISKIFISHLHADHFLGLPGLLSSMSLLGRENELQIFGPKGLKEFIDTTFKVSETWLNFPVRFIETQDKFKECIYEDEHITIHSFPLFHRIACTGFLFQEKEKARKFDKKLLDKYFLTPDQIIDIKNGADFHAPDGNFYPNSEITISAPPIHSYAYCSDTAPYEGLIEHIKGVDTIYHEATFTSHLSARAKETRHSTATQAAQTAKDANAKKLILGHFSTRYPDTSELVKEAQDIFPNTFAANDGESFEI